MSAEKEPAGEARPTVSVVMVCYNGSDLLAESLASLRAQTYTDWELLFWDNGSTDGSADLALAFDKRARLFGGTERLTLGAARGKAVAEARGDLIAFLDHDDVWRDDKLERQVALLHESGAGLAYADCDVIDAAGTWVGSYAQRVRPREGRVHASLLMENFIPTVTVVITRAAYEAAGPFDPSINMPADYDQWLRVARRSEVVYDGDRLGAYRLSASGLTSDVDSSYEQVDALFERLVARAEGDDEARAARRGRARHLWMWAARGLLGGSGLSRAFRRFRAGWNAAGSLGQGAAALAAFLVATAHGVTVRLAMDRARRRE